MEDKISIAIEETISIRVFQSGGLVRHTRWLADTAARSTNDDERVCLATAALLMGAAALECVAMEAAYFRQLDCFRNKGFRLAGMPEKLKVLAGHPFKYAEDLWVHRKAVTHAELDNRRSQDVGSVLNAQGAKWVAGVVEDISRELWADKMPTWFTEITGIAPKVT